MCGGQPPVTLADTGQARHLLGLGPEMRPQGFTLAHHPRRWPAARACGLVWRLRPCLARTAPGGVGAPPGWVLRPACEELADGRGCNTSEKARPDAE